MPKLKSQPKKVRASKSARPRKRKESPSTAIVRVSPAPERPWELNSQQVALLKNYLHLGDASEIEVQACLEVARRYRLDPFKQGQIWFIKRWDSGADNGQGGRGAFVRVPQVGIYGLLHIAARDHADFGSLSEPEYGPMIQMDVEGHKFKAPEWCRVKAFKKGLAEPTVATIYFEEFCPQKWDNAKLFWAKMQRNQIAKCCKAQVVRAAYPDLAGLTIPEEMERMKDDYAPSGRQIVEASATGSRAAAQAVAQAKIAGTFAQPPAEPEKPATEPPKAQIPNTPIEVHPEQASKGTVEIDQTDEASPIIRGDIAEILPQLQERCKTMAWKDEWWRIEPRDVENAKAVCVYLGFRVLEILPKEPPKQPIKTSGPKEAPASQTTKPTGKRQGNTPAEPDVVFGTIERVNAGMAGKYPVRQVTLLLADKTKPTFGCFDKDLFEHLDAGLGKAAALIIKENKGYKNIIGAKQIGAKEFDVDGKTVCVQRNREAGGKTLFP